jgi:hypothetical protein
MGSICRKIWTKAAIEDVWSAIRDIGALHTRLVPGFVTDTRVEPGARIVTFGNGMVLREPIITVDDNARRVVWSAEGGPFTHYNASLQAFAEDGATRVVWIADFLPEEVASNQQAAMDAALQVMKATLDRLAENRGVPRSLMNDSAACLGPPQEGLVLNLISFQAVKAGSRCCGKPQRRTPAHALKRISVDSLMSVVRTHYGTGISTDPADGKPGLLHRIESQAG